MKKTIKFLIVLMTTLVITTMLNVNAASGYTYDHKGQPIYSTIGMTINQEPFLASDLGIDNKDFASPEDLFIYTDDNGTEYIYIADSASNKIFILDKDLHLVNTLSSFKVTVDNFSDDVLKEIKNDKVYVINRDKLLTIPYYMEKVNLVKNETTTEQVKLDYDVNTTLPYTLTWTVSNKNVVDIQKISNVPYLVAQGVGKATITGTMMQNDDPATDDVDESKTQLGNVTINVEVADTDLPDTVNTKINNFSLKEIRTIDSFDLKLSGVTSVYRAKNPNNGKDYIYLCDKGNNQVVVIDSLTYEVVQFVTIPKDELTDKAFAPYKLITDNAGRMYVIADNVYEGIMQFSAEGKFNSYTGVNYVSLTPWQIFWRNFSTEEQLRKQATIINTSFTSITVRDNFIYTTTNALLDENNLVTNDNAMIKKINPSGKDVLRRNGYQPPKGDVIYVRAGTDSTVRNPSQFSGITVNDNGVYTVVDRKMGKLFTYDNEGRLLYISGEANYAKGSGASEINALSNPVAVRYLGDNLLVLDKNNRAIVVYEPTDIGKLINQAVALEYIGNREEAATIWEEVVKQNANYEYAYLGIGKKYQEQKDYKTAMEYFKIGADRNLYSKAYEMYRDQKIRQNFGWFMFLIFFLIILYIVLKIINYRKNRKFRIEETGIGDE